MVLLEMQLVLHLLLLPTYYACEASVRCPELLVQALDDDNTGERADFRD